MKANEAPERLYFDVNNNNLIGLYDSAILGMFSAKNTETAIKYTRNDAFVEKAKKWFEQQPETYDANGVRCYGIEDFENFVNSMQEEPVSEDLEEVAVDYGNRSAFTDVDPFNWILEIAFKDGACWQKQQIMKDATEVTVHIEAGNYPYIPQIELYDYDKDIPLAKEGDKYKVVLIKEE